MRAKKEQNFTELLLDSLKFNGEITYYWDKAVPAFGIRVSKTRKTFTVIRGKKRERITVGHYPTMPLKEARKLARGLLDAPEPTGPTIAFNIAMDDFLTSHVDTLKSGKGIRRILKKHFTWTTPLARITRQDVQAVLNRLAATPSEGNHAFKYLRTFFLWCVRRGLLDHSPIAAMKMPFKETTRERTLSDEELRQIWKHLKDDTFSTIVKLLILTGQRRTEVQHLVVEGDMAKLTGQYAKNGREHIFPLPAAALPLLQRDLTFNGWSKSKARLDKACGVSAWTLHDLRRTYATTHARLGTPIHVIERLLNHVSGSISGVAAIYNRYSYAAEMRAAVDSYEAYLRKLLSLR